MKPQRAPDKPAVSMQHNQSRKRHVHVRFSAGRELLGATRDVPVTRHARCSDTSAIWMSLRSTLHVVDAVLVYPARLQGCAGLEIANIVSKMHWNNCSVKGGQKWSSTRTFTLYWGPLEAISKLWVLAPEQKNSMCPTFPTIKDALSRNYSLQGFYWPVGPRRRLFLMFQRPNEMLCIPEIGPSVLGTGPPTTRPQHAESFAGSHSGPTWPPSLRALGPAQLYVTGTSTVLSVVELGAARCASLQRDMVVPPVPPLSFPRTFEPLLSSA